MSVENNEKMGVKTEKRLGAIINITTITTIIIITIISTIIIIIFTILIIIPPNATISSTTPIIYHLSLFGGVSLHGSSVVDGIVVLANGEVLVLMLVHLDHQTIVLHLVVLWEKEDRVIGWSKWGRGRGKQERKIEEERET